MLLLLTALSLAAPTAPPTSLVSLSLSSQPASLATFLGPVDEEKKEANFSYTYLELGYGVLDLDAIDDEADSLYGRASLGLFEVLHIFLDYSNPSTDYEDTTNDIFGLGVGAHFGVMPKLDLVGEASWLYSDLSSDVDELDDTNNGYALFAGARWMPLPWDGGGLEINGGFRWIDLQGLLSDDTTGAYEAGARFHFLKLFSVGAKYEFLGDDARWGVDARASF